MSNVYRGFLPLLLAVFYLFGCSDSLEDKEITRNTIQPPVNDTLKSQILILGTPHLRSLGESYKPSLLDSLLTVLERYNPDLIGVESMPPYLIEDMERKGGSFIEVLNQFAKERIDYGRISRNYLKISRTEAEEKSDSLLNVLSSQPQKKDLNSIRSKTVLYMLASYDLNSALLQWSYLPEDMRTTNRIISKDISEFLDNELKKSNEIVAIGVELAKKVGLQKIESIDDHQDKDVFLSIAPDLISELQNDTLYQSVAKSPFFVDSQKRLQEAVQQGDLLSYYLYMNSFDYMSKDVETQWHLFFRTKLKSGLDRSRFALWEVRNLNIASHIRRATVLFPGKRMLVIIGAAHKPFLDLYLSQMADIKMINLNEIIRPEN